MCGPGVCENKANFQRSRCLGPQREALRLGNPLRYALRRWVLSCHTDDRARWIGAAREMERLSY
jgi:hypothetical protein